MNRSVSLAVVAIGATLFGCQSQQQAVDQMQPDAQMVAQRRGAFELNCPSATATVLNKEMMQTAMAGPFYNPPQRAEYTVGVSGCGKQTTYLVVCAVGGTGCIAAGARNNAPTQQ
ncbi:MAG TPA: hypothetical protein VGP32_10285 [Steroidobacteraceae bacterium]|jgi:hypothetical protein|nr:hypothetical protein [Steroidobacteraceae bacterium]